MNFPRTQADERHAPSVERTLQGMGMPVKGGPQKGDLRVVVALRGAATDALVRRRGRGARGRRAAHEEQTTTHGEEGSRSRSASGTTSDS